VKQTDDGIVRQQLKINLSYRRTGIRKPVALVFTVLSNKTGNVRINIEFYHVPATIVAVEKTINITYYDCVFVAFGIQHALCMSHISSMATPTLQFFSNYLTNGKIFDKRC